MSDGYFVPELWAPAMLDWVDDEPDDEEDGP